MDIKLPICDGIGAAARIHAERLAPIRVLAAFFQRDPVDKARVAGGYAHLVKPFTVVELRLRGRSTVSQAEGYLNGRFGLSTGWRTGSRIPPSISGC
ncbi:hypothetical protein ACGFNP_43650 [Nonomuraea sp. NPDC049269]|uniref:hypothetical protein n=1 Tax=Nonomuraea sp. NPDC049269 TaxID=3364349 RepID=UPI00371B5507